MHGGKNIQSILVARLFVVSIKSELIARYQMLAAVPIAETRSRNKKQKLTRDGAIRFISQIRK